MRINIFIVLGLLVYFCFSVPELSLGREPEQKDQVFSLIEPACFPQYSQSGTQIFRWHLDKRREQYEPIEKKYKYTWTVTRYCMNTQEKKTYTIHSEISKKIYELRGSLGTNRPCEVLLTVSPDGEFFLLRYFDGTSVLIRSKTGEEISFTKEKILEHHEGESLLGFTPSGNLFCGLQSLNPFLITRDIQTFDTKERFHFAKLSWMPEAYMRPESWLDGDMSYKNIGILYSVLPSPQSNKDAGVTVLAFTTFQFRFLMAMVVVYDNNSENFVTTQTLVDTTQWFERESVFLWSFDGRYFAVHDGRQKLQIYDKSKRCFSDVCSIAKVTKDGWAYIKKARFLPNGEIVVEIKAYDQGIVIWSPQTREFREPFFFTPDLKPSVPYTIQVLSVSSKGDYIATSVIKNVGIGGLISQRYIDIADTIEFWSTKDKKKVHTLQLKSRSNVYFAPDWSLLELERFDNDNQKLESEVIDLTKILPLQNSSIHQVREWNSTVGTKTNAKYISSTETAVKLEKEDGKIITVPLVKLSQEDQEYIKQLVEEMKKNK